jgi:hypothetical protein
MASAIQNTNNWQPSANYITAAGLTRTNPYANDGEDQSVELFGVDTFQARHTIAFTWVVASAGAQITFTPSTGATTATDYIKFTVVDESGNEAYATGFQSSAATTALVVATTALNKNDDWKVIYSTSNSDGATQVQFSYHIDEAAIYGNSSGTKSYTLS